MATKNSTKLLQWVEGCYSDYPLQSLRNIRLLTYSSNATIQQISDTGVLPQIIQLLKSNNYTFEMFMVGYIRELQFGYITSSDIINEIQRFANILCIDDALQVEARCILCNVTCDLKIDDLQYILHPGDITILLNGLHVSTSITVKSTSLRLLENIILNGVTKYRDLLLHDYIIARLVSIINNIDDITTTNNQKIELLRDTSGLLSVLCYHKPPPKPEFYSKLFEALSLFRNINDMKTLENVLWGFSRVAREHPSLVNNEFLEEIIECLDCNENKILRPVLKIITHKTYESNTATQNVINFGALKGLKLLLETNMAVRWDICWILSKIAAGTTQQIEAMIEENFFPKLMEIANATDRQCAVEAFWAICNAIIYGNKERIGYFVNIGIIPTLCLWLEKPLKDKVLKLGMDTLNKILSSTLNLGTKDSEHIRDVMKILQKQNKPMSKEESHVRVP